MNTTTPRSERRDKLVTVVACAAVGAALLLSNPATYRVPQPVPPRAHSTAYVAPDWTVAPCSWIGTRVLPPYTYTDRCAEEDGTLISVTGGVISSVQLPTT